MAFGAYRSPSNERTQDNENIGTVFVCDSPSKNLEKSAVPPTNHILSVYELKTQPELIRYYHAAAGFPMQPTWLATIRNGHYATWKGLTAAGVRRHFQESGEFWQGHGRKVRSGLRSTKKLIEMEQDGKVTTKIELKTNTIFSKTYDLSDNSEQRMYTDQTGKFPVRSYRGMQYITVLFEVDSNGKSLRDRSSGELVQAY